MYQHYELSLEDKKSSNRVQHVNITCKARSLVQTQVCLFISIFQKSSISKRWFEMEGTAQNLIEMETEQRGHTSVAANHNTRHLLFFHNTEAVHSSILQI